MDQIKLEQQDELHNPMVQPSRDPRAAARGDGPRERLVDVYRRWFDVIPATSDALLEKAYRLRYQVYCVENPFEDPAENPDGLETDEYDAHAVHSLLVHRPSGATAGTVRLILPEPPMGAVRLVLPDPKDRDGSLPILKVCDHPLLRDRQHFPVEEMAEVSRFCISKDFRRRRGDTRYPGVFDNPAIRPAPDEERRLIPHMTLGLIEALVRMSVENGVQYWCAVMEPPLLRLLARLGIHFDPIGEMIDYHGKRQPCYRKLDELLAQVWDERADVWEVLTDEGAHWDALKAIAGASARA